MKTIIVTGGAGFMGSVFCELAISKGYKVVVIDKLTYAGNITNLESIKDNPNYSFFCVDIQDHDTVSQIFSEYSPDAIFNFAAESHVDRSISDPNDFIYTNIIGTYNLLNVSLKYLKKNDKFTFIHISTDEVYGSLGPNDPSFDENSRYDPNSPYSASKASSDHLCKAWYKTYNLPVILTNCTNNFGERQHDEKFIPTIIRNAIEGKEIPIYGDGSNVRDWIYVKDHAIGVLKSYEVGEPGKKYLFSSSNEIKNIDLALTVCSMLNNICSEKEIDYRKFISLTKDRPGHDFRYSIDSTNTNAKLGIVKGNSFENDLRDTIKWFEKKYRSV